MIRAVAGNAFNVALSTAALALMQWGMMAVIARIDGPRELGYYTLAQAFAVPASYLAWLGMRQQLLVSRQDMASPGDYMLLRLLAPGVAFALLAVAIAALYREPGLTAIAAGVLLIRYAEGFFDLAYGRLQRAGDSRRVATTSLTRCAASFALFAAIYIPTRALAPALIAVAGLRFAMFLLSRESLWPGERAALNRARARALARQARDLAPLGLGLTVMSLATNAPRFVVDAVAGAEQLGYFAASFHFLALGSVVVGSLGHALMPMQADAVRAGRRGRFWRAFLAPAALLLVASAIATAIAWRFGDLVMALAYGPRFAAHGDLLVMAAAVSGPYYVATLAAGGCLTMGQQREYLVIQIVVLCAIVAAVMLLAPCLGVASAYAGVLFGSLVQIVASVGVQIWRWPEPEA